MMRLTFFISTTIFFSLSAAGQDFEHVDKALNKCLLDSAGEVGRQGCCRLATEEWMKIIKDLERKIIKTSPSGRKQFEGAVKSWEAYKDAELDFLSTVVTPDSKALMNGSVYEERRMRIYRNRANELMGYYKMIIKEPNNPF